MKIIYLSPLIFMAASCSTMNESLQLGSGVGALTGATAVYSAGLSTASKPSTSSIATSAAIGAGLGLIASYFVHRSVENERKLQHADQTEMYFGDLPPSPFIVPKMKIKKGGHR